MNGSLSHWSTGPVGTTSVCPAKHSSGAAAPRRAHRLSTSLQRTLSMLKPIFSKRLIRISWQPLSNGVSERQAIRACARASVSFCMRRHPERLGVGELNHDLPLYAAQQLIDAGLRSGFCVHLLHND